MDKEGIRFEDFLMDVTPDNLGFVMQAHEHLTGNGCTVKILPAKSGYVVSYHYGKSKKVVVNFVFRKKGLMIRIYGDHISSYSGILDTLPAEMIKQIEKAPACKRLLDPAKCNARCPMGYVFTLNDAEHKKCRYSGFMFLVNDESAPYLKRFIENELKERSA